MSTEKKKQHILIVGGGFAGVKTAVELSGNEDFDVTLVTPHSRFEYHGAMYRSATGRSPLEVVVPLSEIFANSPNVKVELDSVVELRPDVNEVEGETGRTYSYDMLVLAIGYVVNYFGIEGMAQHSESMYSITDAIKLRHKLVGTFRSQPKEEPIDISVIGAGPTGVEIVSDIRNFAKIVEGKHGLATLDVRTHLIEAADRVLPMLSPESSEHALERLQEIGVDVQLNTKVSKATENSLETDKGSVPSDITIWTAGNKANPFFAAYPDVFNLNRSGRVKVNDFFQASRSNVFVIGDAADTRYSGMAQTAIHNAIALAENLTRAVRGEHMHPYRSKRPDYVVPIGGEWALLETVDNITTGAEGWKTRREADRWVLENFLVYELANKHYQQGDRIANI